MAPGVKLIDTPEFPAAYKAEAAKGGGFLDLLRRETALGWTFLSPSAMVGPGEWTGKFRLGTDQLLTNEAGSSISWEDYAIAAVDELEKPAHVRQRFTVGYWEAAEMGRASRLPCPPFGGPCGLQPDAPYAPISSASVSAITSVALYKSASGRRSSARWALASSIVWGPAP